jgi:hypothetical protein
MNESEHRLRHIQLHQALDELVADFLTHNPDKRPSTATIMELIKWSHEQTQNPTKDKA